MIFAANYSFFIRIGSFFAGNLLTVTKSYGMILILFKGVITMIDAFREQLQKIVNLTDDEKIGLALESIRELAPEIRRYSDDDSKVTGTIIAIFATSIAADGKLNAQELALIHAFLDTAGIEIKDVDELVALIRACSTNEAYDLVRTLNKILSVDGQASLITLVAAICAIDDKIESNEVAYLNDLFEEA